MGLPNYNLHYDNSPSSAGGVAIYIKSSLQYKVCPNARIDVEDCESLFIEISPNSDSKNAKSRVFIVGCVYRHPRPSTSLFMERLCNKLITLTDNNTPVVLMGDINIDVSKTLDKTAQNYMNMLSIIGCVNHINMHTRLSGNSQSCLDHILSNIDGKGIICGVINEPITDHLPTFAFMKNALGPCSSTNMQGCNNPMWRFYDDRKKDKFLEVLEENLKKVDLSLEPDNLLESLIAATNTSIDECFPLKDGEPKN